VLYTRVSDPKQAREGDGLNRQNADCKEFCKKRGLKIIREFADPGNSGRIDKRTGFLAMIKFCKLNSKLVKSIVIWDIDRIFRNAFLHLRYRYELWDLGINFVSPFYDFPEVPDASEVIASAEAQRYSEDLSRMGKKSALRTLGQGRLNWKAPIGYLNERDTNKIRGTKVVHDPVAAPIIAELFSLYVNTDRPRSELRKWATSRGLVNHRTQKPVASGTFYKIFTNIVYAGIIYHEELGFIKADFAPIVSRELFERAFLKAKSSGRMNIVQKTGSGFFPLKGVICCPSCRVKLSGSKPNKRNYRYYQFYRHKPDCKYSGLNISAEKAENGFLNLLKSLKVSSVLFDFMQLVTEDIQSSSTKKISEEIESSTEEIKKIQSKLDNLAEMRASGEIDADRYKRITEKNWSILQELKQQIVIAEAKKPPLASLAKQAVWALDHLEMPWLACMYAGKARFAKALFSAGVTSDKQGNIRVLGDEILGGLIQEKKQ